MKRIIFLIAVLVFGLAKISGAFSLIEFQGGGQGRLVNLDGTPVRDSTRMMGFAIWTDSTGGTMLWSETQMVQTQAGLFNVYLGDSIPLTMDVFSHPAPRKYLEVSVGGEILSPRTLLGASPLAQVACRLVGDLETGYDSLNQVGFIKKGVRIVGEAGQTANLLEIFEFGGIQPSVKVAADGKTEVHLIKLQTLMGDVEPALSVYGVPGQTANFMEIKNSAGTPLVSIDANGDMDGLNSTWENLQAVDISCNGAFNAGGDAIVGGNVGIGTGAAIPHSTLYVNGSIATKVEFLPGCASTTLDESHSVVLVSAVLGECFLNLPTAVGIQGRQYTIKAVPTFSGTYNIIPFAGQTIDGNASYILTAVNKYVTIVSDGANWQIIGSN